MPRVWRSPNAYGRRDLRDGHEEPDKEPQPLSSRLMKNSIRAADDPEWPSAASARLAVFSEYGSAASPCIWPLGIALATKRVLHQPDNRLWPACGESHTAANEQHAESRRRRNSLGSQRVVRRCGPPR
jgi:hypothetical protein